MSAWPGSEGAPLFKTAEKSGKPELVGIFNYFEPGKLGKMKGVDKDECVTNVGCNISHIKKHVYDGEWSRKGQACCFTHVLRNTQSALRPAQVRHIAILLLWR